MTRGVNRRSAEQFTFEQEVIPKRPVKGVAAIRVVDIAWRAGAVIHPQTGKGERCACGEATQHSVGAWARNVEAVESRNARIVVCFLTDRAKQVEPMACLVDCQAAGISDAAVFEDRAGGAIGSKGFEG